jgi:hypothetical protein
MAFEEDTLDRLPDLPLDFESMGPLERSDHGPFLTIRHPRVGAARSATALPAPKKKTSHAARHNFAWAIYPKLVCYEPGLVVQGLASPGDTPPEPLDVMRSG